MYDLPELEDANDALVTAFEMLALEAGVDPPIAPVTQICGYPLQTVDRGKYTLLGIPCYRLTGCDGPAHRSFIVVSRSSRAKTIRDLRGGSFALNSLDSNTGMNLPRRSFAAIAQRKPFFNNVIVTGSHRSSMRAVVQGQADAAAIDCVTFGLHADYNPAAIAGLRILAHTSASPGIPFVTARTTSRRTVGSLRRALQTFSTHAGFVPLRKALRIERIAPPSETAYDVVLHYAAEAAALGYPELT
jgi:ABC-type phosphate/phosphonate transport system substrate-binding protein